MYKGIKDIQRMEDISATEIIDLVSKFSEKLLPKQEWNHQAHIIVAVWHNMNYDFDTALNLVRFKIKAYNISVGTLNTEDSGYHETLTIFWMKLTKFFLQKHPSEQIEEICNHFLQSEYASQNYPLKYYSRETLFSKQARKNWITGDIKETPFFLDDN